MELIYGLIGFIMLFAAWFFCGWLVVSSTNFLSMYFNGKAFFHKGDSDLFDASICFGPLMFVWILYPVWLLIKAIYEYIYENLGRTVVVEDIRKYTYDYRHKFLSIASTKSLSNFFNAYMDKDTNKFSHGNEGDRNAIENFFRVDGWRNVGDGVWTKIVKVKDLNTGA